MMSVALFVLAFAIVAAFGLGMYAADRMQAKFWSDYGFCPNCLRSSDSDAS